MTWNSGISPLCLLLNLDWKLSDIWKNNGKPKKNPGILFFPIIENKVTLSFRMCFPDCTFFYPLSVVNLC